jgi:hypothetical protein
MKIEIPRAAAEAFLKAAGHAGRPGLAGDIGEILSYGAATLSLDASRLDDAALEALHGACKAAGARGAMIRISSLRTILKDPGKGKIGNLEALAEGLVAYLKDGAIDGWLYRVGDDGALSPYLVTGVRLEKPYGRNADNRPRVAVKMARNSASERQDDGLDTFNAYFDSDDIVRTTVPALLAKEGLFKETAELKAEYESGLAAFRRFQPMHGRQFLCRGRMMDSLRRWRNEVLDTPAGAPARLVNDEELVHRKVVDLADADFWRGKGVKEGFDAYPAHCYLHFFHLGLHRQVWAHASNVEPYEYDPGLRDKLVLPREHRDLVDILVTDMDVLMEDVVAGKGGGTTILCKGGPGLGKTLTAEVYCEFIGRPLYKVNAGQLGSSSGSVEERLQPILDRASRWGAVLLLDEADVYIRARDDDMDHNAVVTCFLRTLEHFNGLLFMTTNRGDDVDDAIVSRCIAVIRYELPTARDAKLIWGILAGQFKVGLPDTLVDELVEAFPAASGRDIKELLKLTSKFARKKGVPLSCDVFRQCAQFRGVAMKRADA